MAETPFYLTEEDIRAFCRIKLDSGVSSGAVAKYATTLSQLGSWLGDDRTLTARRLGQWRNYLESSGLSKATVQNCIKHINHYLRSAGHPELCIPKPLRNDLRGRTFGYLTALEPTQKRRRTDILWLCRCKCGREVEIPAVALLGGKTASCGCLKQEILSHANRYEEGTGLRQALSETVTNPNSASGYVGVAPKGGKWIAYIYYKGTRHNLGTFGRLEDAVKARARAKEAVMEDAARIYEETACRYGQRPARPEPPERHSTADPGRGNHPACRSDNTSGCPGVNRSKGKWAASITVKKTRYRLGSYQTREEAAAARKRAEALAEAGDLDGLSALSQNRVKECDKEYAGGRT